jgi:DNA helicase-2/ATP-dependent DNA helicase PcrA
VVWSQQAVLVRTNAQTAAIAGALEAHGIPARVRSQTSFLEQPAIKEAIAALRRDGFTEGLAALDAALEIAPTTELAELGELVRLAGEYTEIDPAPSATGFTGWLSTILARDDTYHGGSAVEVVTFHAAKGLEWPVVHVAGLEAGFVPNARARTADAIDEERRLFYVAVTRAERELRLSWAASRTFGTKEVRRQRSPFLAELEPVLQAMAEASAPVDGAAFLAAARGPRRSTVTTLFTELEEWRAARARAVGLSAQAVLDDDSLGALAAARPVDELALQAVPGIGPMLATRLAAEVLPIIARHPDVESASDG